MSQSPAVPERSHLPKSRDHRDAPVGIVSSSTDIWIDKRLFARVPLRVLLVPLRLKIDPRVVRWVQGRLLRVIVSPLRRELAGDNCMFHIFARGITYAEIMPERARRIRILVRAVDCTGCGVLVGDRRNEMANRVTRIDGIGNATTHAVWHTKGGLEGVNPNGRRTFLIHTLHALAVLSDEVAKVSCLIESSWFGVIERTSIVSARYRAASSWWVCQARS